MTNKVDQLPPALMVLGPGSHVGKYPSWHP